jgi:hypothetical protein
MMSGNESIQAEQDPMDGSSEKTAVPPMATFNVVFPFESEEAAKNFCDRKTGEGWECYVEKSSQA